jgi:bifunctional DNA-binding transcriptional regulator/antitoxin component of YhaV-PrlF toxin-antitoxin module
MLRGRVPLRKINEALRITLPINYTRKLGLKPGDFADLTVEDGKVCMKFIKVKTPAEFEIVELAETA